MKIAIVDDERPSRSELRHLISDYLAEGEIMEASSGEEAMKLFLKEDFDLIFMDINLGDIDGATLAAMAKRAHPNVEIVFATAYNNYAEKAFDIDALNYILKPFDPKRIEQTIQRYMKKRATDNNAKEGVKEEEKAAISKISINCDKKMILVDIADIVYIETGNRSCIVHTKTKSYTTASSMNSFEERLKDNGFFRIHKSILINLEYVIEIYPWFNNTTCVKMQGYEKEILTVGRNQIKELKLLFSM
ncbi:LytR/AlgR family response regulator transcription factor [Anaerotignum sp. MB30-C6]|uniref:LytR/AlgR family response regulator transcription factor n=1 Tax=Anaerotignum sp. MB30-C6 TaxID=3070814 RepID=UPI0027DC89FB|nr:LytTR family DNA-binding domain-containing protein [Anaerotignum sp. MB30-C6]WMI81307.1 LytTR family DNA-binding domain-containing protein [Anaerotignum sp. MB30-C6]